MFEIVGACGRAIAAGAIVVAVAACGSEVEVDTTGAGGGSSTSSASSGDASVSSSSAGGSGGSGGSGGLPAPTCAKGEAAILAALAWQNGKVVVNHEGTWTEGAPSLAGAYAVTTYVDVYNHLGVFWTEQIDAWRSHFATTSDGTSFDVHDAHGWFPQAWSPLVTVGRSLLLGNAGEGSVLAYFDPDAFDWHPYPDPAPFDVTSAVIREAAGTVLGVGLGPLHDLCDTEIFWADGGSWTDPHCRDDVEVFMGNEIPVAPPRAVALPNGDVVVVYHESYVKLAATMNHAGIWSAPESITLPEQGLDVALTTTPGGDVIVGVPGTSGGVFALRYGPGVGWGEPFPIGTTSSSTSPISAAPGICGDDALIAYVDGGIDGEVRVARIRGDAAEVSTVEWFTEDVPNSISITTRRPDPSP
ncbi:hypothetical protein [Polyangium sp. 6x1]|uniref:hypothetical protein n=1 Tax=Polyangium sp. 6x1 TaxID=3042689 RepID=UPI0024823C69|nr:hypothetical protein [Polyangium sp. 6x1]MDI1442640.1 hypothetical protein [Polyangium sp. 6x1]